MSESLSRLCTVALQTAITQIFEPSTRTRKSDDKNIAMVDVTVRKIFF